MLEFDDKERLRRLEARSLLMQSYGWGSVELDKAILLTKEAVEMEKETWEKYTPPLPFTKKQILDVAVCLKMVKVGK